MRSMLAPCLYSRTTMAALGATLATGALSAPVYAQDNVPILPIADIYTPFVKEPGLPGIDDIGTVTFRDLGNILVGDSQEVMNLSSAYTAFGPVINGNGLVLFSTGANYFTYDTKQYVLNKVLNPDGLPYIGAPYHFFLNNAGTVAWAGSPTVSQSGNEVGDNGVFSVPASGGALTTIVHRTTPGFSKAYFYEPYVAINHSGTVAFAALNGNPASNVLGIYTGTGGQITTIATRDIFGTPRYLGNNSLVIDDSGTVAFSIRWPMRLYAGNGTSLVHISEGLNFILPAEFPVFSMNRHGVIAFRASEGPSQFPDRRGAGIYRYDTKKGGTPTPVATIWRVDPTDPIFPWFSGAPAINSRGTIVFSAASQRGEGPGIYVVLPDNPKPLVVVQAGAPLFGSVITDLAFHHRQGLSDGDQLAFRYTLANGVTGIARADIATFAARRTVAGRVTLQGLSTFAAPRVVTFTFRPVGGGTPTTFLREIGPTAEKQSFSLRIPNGTYTLAIKGDQYLRQTLTVEAGATGAVTIPDITLLAGDVNNDNKVNLTDLVRLRANYGKSGVDREGDLTGNGTVNLSDLVLLRSNYGKSGQP